MYDLLSQIARVKPLVWPLIGLVLSSVKWLYDSLTAVFRDHKDVMDKRVICKTEIVENTLDGRKKVIERRWLHVFMVLFGFICFCDGIFGSGGAERKVKPLAGIRCTCH